MTKQIKDSGYYKLKEKVLKEIIWFFNQNSGTDIDIEEIEGSPLTIVSFEYGKIDVDKINSDGVTSLADDVDIPFEDIALCDLSAIIDVINNYTEDLNKTMDSCKSNNF